MAHLGRAAVFVALLAQVAVASSRSTHGGIVPSNASTNEREDVASAGELRGSRAAETGGARRALALTGAAVSAAVEPHKVSELRARLSHLLDGKVEAPAEETEEAEETETPLEDVTDLHTKLNHEDNLDQHKLALDPKKKVQINPDTGEPVSERNAALSGDQYYFYTTISAIFLASGIFMWCVFLPSLYFSEQAAFEELSKAGIGDRTFNDFLVYRFNNWMNAEGLAANTKILLGGTLSLVTAGSLLYICVTGRRIQEGLWLTFLWASASSVDAGSPRASGTVGVAVTVGGVILLAILLGTVTEFFAEKVQASKEGRDAVVEGGHILVLGHSANTKSLLEELALADPEKQMTVVLLDRKPKQEVEKCIQDQNTRLGNLKLVVRSGHASAWQDLKKVAADMASRIVIPEDPTATREESDANNFGTLLTLRGQQWPKNGYVTVQCCATRNDSIMREMGPSPTLVLNGERLGRLMVQSARDHGLCQVFSQIIGFEGDELRQVSEGAWRRGLDLRDARLLLPHGHPHGRAGRARDLPRQPQSTAQDQGHRQHHHAGRGRRHLREGQAGAVLGLRGVDEEPLPGELQGGGPQRQRAGHRAPLQLLRPRRRLRPPLRAGRDARGRLRG